MYSFLIKQIMDNMTMSELIQFFIDGVAPDSKIKFSDSKIDESYVIFEIFPSNYVPNSETPEVGLNFPIPLKEFNFIMDSQLEHICQGEEVNV